MSSDTHQAWMRRALNLSEKGRLLVSPNPIVGACIVKNGKLISDGYHHVYGGAHAEVEALKTAGPRARGASLYVTLEPCSSWGKTPPCVSAIIRSGIKKVVVGTLDPNPRHKGKGIQALRQAGIQVISGVLEKEVISKNHAFLKWITTGLPFVTLKMAQTLDGKIATRLGESRWISSPPARQYVHRLRAEHDAVLVGNGTFVKDDPLLSPRMNIKLSAGKPWRIAALTNPKISPRARIFQGEQITLLAVPEKKLSRFSSLNKNIKSVSFLPVRELRGRLDFFDLLKKLGSLGIARLLIEGGGETAWSFISQGLVDRFLWIVAPKFFGGRDAKTSLEGTGVSLPKDAFQCDLLSIEKLGEDLLIEGKIRPCLPASSSN